MTGAGFPHSDTLGSQLGWQLPEAYRSLPRPSSAPDAKTSTVCPYTLTTTQNTQGQSQQTRCSRPLCTSQRTTTHHQHTHPHPPKPQGHGMSTPTAAAPRKHTTHNPHATRAETTCSPFPQDPTVHRRTPPPPTTTKSSSKRKQNARLRVPHLRTAPAPSNTPGNGTATTTPTPHHHHKSSSSEKPTPRKAPRGRPRNAP